MFVFRNNLGFGAFMALITAGVKIALDVVYKVLKATKLSFLAVVLLVGAILFITKVLPGNLTVLIIFFIFVFLALFYAIFANYIRIAGFLKKVFGRRRKNNEREEASVEQNVQNDTQGIVSNSYVSKGNYPKYYTVKQNKNYVMAEYEDRFELFLKQDGKLVKVRTDRKV